MSIQCIHAADVPAQAWRNGGGQTRELLAWPAGAHWQVRISRADIDRDGPFSAFPQVDRWFAVLHGHGVQLDFQGVTRTVALGDGAVQFDGAAAPDCRLVDGPTQDLNLMLRQASGFLQRWHPGSTCPETHTLRGLYTTVGGRWRGAMQAIDIDAHTLVWSDNDVPGPWTFEPRQATNPADSAWWFGATPQD